jgi:hypothetical protein
LPSSKVTGTVEPVFQPSSSAVSRSTTALPPPSPAREPAVKSTLSRSPTLSPSTPVRFSSSPPKRTDASRSGLEETTSSESASRFSTWGESGVQLAILIT